MVPNAARPPDTIDAALEALRSQRAMRLDRRVAGWRELSLIVARQNRLAGAEAIAPLLASGIDDLELGPAVK